MNFLNVWSLISLVILIMALVQRGLVEAERRPSVIWSPYNPIFDCEEPTMNVNINDDVKFLCPYTDGGFFMPPSAEKPMYENMYMVDSQQYESCNATGGKILLNCKSEHSVRDSSMKLLFRSVKTSPDSLVFNEGSTYYLIGTGFRTKQELSNVVGGSCNTTENIPGYKQHKLRLKIYICTEEEKKNGTCKTCTDSSCYSEACRKECSKWEMYTSVTSVERGTKPSISKRTVYKRICNSSSGVSKPEYKSIEKNNCSLVTCSTWTRSIDNINLPQTQYSIHNLFLQDNNCTALHQQTCYTSCGFDYKFYKYLGVACPKPTCTDWQQSSITPNKDFSSVVIGKRRKCTNTEHNQTVEILCKMSCSDWSENKNSTGCKLLSMTRKPNKGCTALHIRRCSAEECGIDVSFCDFLETTCQPVAGEKQVAKKEKAETFSSAVIGASVGFVALVIGICFGVYGNKHHHSKHCLNITMKPNQVTAEENKSTGKVNLAYQYSVTGEKDDSLARKSVYFTDNTATISEVQ